MWCDICRQGSDGAVIVVAYARQRALVLEGLRCLLVQVGLVGDESHVDALDVLLYRVVGGAAGASSAECCAEGAQALQLHVHALLQQLGYARLQCVQHVLHLAALSYQSVTDHVLSQSAGAQHRGVESLGVVLAALARVARLVLSQVVLIVLA